MMDILFNNSAVGSLKAAQTFGKGSYTSQIAGICLKDEDGGEPTQEELDEALRQAEDYSRLEWERAVPLGGSAGDIYGFDLALSFGEITENEPGPQRLHALSRLFSLNDHVFDIGSLLQTTREDWEDVRHRALEGESARIWYSSRPEDLCGLHWFLCQLEQWEAPPCELFLVRLPEWSTDWAGNLVQRRGWGELPPGEWSTYLAAQQPLPSALRCVYAARWRALQEENAPLRAVVNGQLVSVPLSFYDSMIQREIDAEDDVFEEAAVVMRTLRRGLGIGDDLIALRIEEMIQAGRLAPVTQPAEGANIYSRLLRKV